MRSKKAILNIGSSLFLQLVTFICGFIIPKLIITNFGSDVNGLVSSITQFLTYITLLESGFGPVVKAALYKPLANKDNGQIKNILKASEKFFRIIAFIFIIYLIALSLLYPILVNTQFSFVYTMLLILIISISTFAEYFFGMTYKMYLQANQQTYITSIIQIVGYILSTVAVVVLIKFNCNIHIVKLISGFIFVLRPIAQNIYVKKKYKIDLKDADSNFNLKQKWDGMAQHVAAVIYGKTDITLLTIFAKIEEVSVYSVYSMITQGIKRFIQAFLSGIDSIFGDMIAKNEKEKLRKSFSIYETFYYTVITIIFTVTLILILPFVNVYTNGVTDANYHRPLFASIFVLVEFIHAIRMPYSSISLAAGHFKETRRGAWIEAILNIVISTILVFRYGMVGLVIGTFIATAIRTIEFIIHSSKYVLNRNLYVSIVKVGISIIEMACLTVLFKNISFIEVNSYVMFIKSGIIVTAINSIIIVMINSIIFGKDVNEIIKFIKRRRKENENFSNDV